MNEKLKELVDYYDNNRNVIISNWKEAEVRIELINPLFECLGWDVNNNQKLADAFKEVRHEASLKIGGTMKAPDYSFNYGKRIFYLEAKTPSVNIKSDISPAYQLRRYGWTAKLPISILSDFEELAIYDCRIKPNKNDNAGVARVKYYTYKDFLEKWDEIYNFISKEAVLHGSLNNFENKQLKGTASIDDDFLNSIESWRKLLALNIALRNTELTENELNFSIQMIIDRIIFLRICEDRGIENYELLKDVIRNGNCYENLLGVFQRADEKYNSGLFHFNKEKDREETHDSITPKLKIDDKTLKDIISDLYYPDCPYELAVISSDVLGNVYERFLGKVISLSKTHKAVIDFKPEVRKAGGVYYTPHYIVEYIVKNTVGEILKDITPAQVSKIKICDPACGSGSFLIEAYQYLLNWHLNYYLNNDPEKWKKGKEPKIFDSQRGLQLTLSERKRILLNNIFGVDIDKNAVEVTKLSLILKVLEYEGQEVNQKSLFNERILPDLYNNIKCGNSLIGSDFYKDQNLSLFDNDEMQKINAFDWEKEFSEVFELGGFDCVIGNPPYDVLEKDRGEASTPHIALQEYIKNNDKYLFALGGKLNLYRFFIIKSSNLLRQNAIFGMIIPMSILSDISTAQTRKFLFMNTENINADCFPQKDNPIKRIFFDAKLSTCIIIFQKKNVKIEPESTIKLRIYPWNSFNDKSRNSQINYHDIQMINNKTLPVPLVDEKQWQLFKRLLNNAGVKQLGNITDYQVNRGEINQTIFRKYITTDSRHVIMLKGAEIGQYILRSKMSQGIKEWFNEKLFLSENNKKTIKDKKRIATQRITGVDEKLRIVATIVNPPAYFADSTNSICNTDNHQLCLEYLLALLNSKLFQWCFKLTSTNNNVGTNELETLPVYYLNIKDSKTEKAIYDSLISLVDQMLSVQEQLNSEKSESDKKTSKQKTDILFKQIDDLVYKLYGLSEDEIKIIENQ